MPQLLYAGGELESVTGAFGFVSEDTNTAVFDTAWARCGIDLTGNGSLFYTPFIDASANPTTVTTGQTLFYHWEHRYANGFSVIFHAVELCDAAGNPWIAFRNTGAVDWFGIFFNTGTAGSPVWTMVGASFNIGTGARATFDLKVTLGSPHTVEFFVNNSRLFGPVTIPAANVTAIAKGCHRGASASGINYIISHSQIMACEGKSTVGGKVRTNSPSAAGSNSAWTGAYTDVNEIGTSDTTLNVAATAGLDQSYAWTDLTVPAGCSIFGVIQFFRGKNDGATPLNIKGLCRSGATNYASAYNAPGINQGFSALPIRWDTDPATAAAWTQTGFNAAEFGYRSAA